MGQQSFVVAVEGGRVDCEGLFGGLQEPSEGGRLVNSEGLKVGKVSATCFAHGVPVRLTCSCCLLCSSTMGPTSGVKVVQSLVAWAVIPGLHNFVVFVGGVGVGRWVAEDRQGRALQGSAQG